MGKNNRAKSLSDVNFHRFIQMEKTANYMEIAEELGISIGQVKVLKKSISRT